MPTETPTIIHVLKKDGPYLLLKYPSGLYAVDYSNTSVGKTIFTSMDLEEAKKEYNLARGLHGTFDEFKNNLPKKVRVHDAGSRRNRILTLSEDKTHYMTANVGTSHRRVFHRWSLENAFDSRLS